MPIKTKGRSKEMAAPSPIYIRIAGGGSAAPLPVGASHWWGVPDLPPCQDLPAVTAADGTRRLLTFVCQLNLADLPASCAALPHRGLLLFFADIDYYACRADDTELRMHLSSPEAVRVIYLTEAQMEGVCPRTDGSDELAPAQPIAFCRKRPPIGEPEHQLLGESIHREWDDWDEPCRGWQLLLQADSDEGEGFCLNFVDCGVLCLLVDPEALRRLDFGGVRGIVLSS